MLRPARSKKRMKLARQCKAKPAIPERRELLFDSLADSTTEDIVQLMAPTSKQKEEDWSSNIPADTVLALLKSGGSLRRVAKNIFRSIHFSIIANLFPNDSSVHVYGYYKDIAHLMLELPVELGEGIETLNISTPLVPAFTRAIAKHCTGLRNFSFAPLARIFPTVSFSSIMAARGPGLKFLGLTNFKGNEGMVNALSHCQSLEHLKISYPRGDFSFEPFWKSVGSSLQHLEILTFGEPLMFKLGALIRNCPNISQLAFDVDHREDEEDWYVEIEAVCQGYASGLVGLKLSSSQIGAERLKKICRTCPNLEITFEENTNCCTGCSKSRSSDIALALGPAALMWTLHYTAENQREEITRVGVSCPNLKEVAMDLNDSLSMETLTDFFSASRPMLKVVDIGTSSVLSLASVLQVLADHVSLESFSCVGEILPMAPFRNFLESQNDLRKISFRNDGWCICQSHYNPPEDFLEAHAQDMGMSWAAIITACIENCSLESICCNCPHWED